MGDALTEQIHVVSETNPIGAAIEVHRVLGPGLLESIYEEALCVEFELQGIPFQRQVEVDVLYQGRVIKGQRIDLLVGDEVIVDGFTGFTTRLKAVSAMPDVLTAQVRWLKPPGISFGAAAPLQGLTTVR